MTSLHTYDFNVGSSCREHRRVKDLIDINNKVLKLEISQSIFIFVGSMCPQYLIDLLTRDLTIKHQVKEDLGSFSFAGTASI